MLYYRLGSWSTAKSYFTTVMEQPVVPDDVRNSIGAYMAQIETREQGSQSFGEVGVGLRYQTNANAGPDSPFIDIGGIEFELDPGALGAADTNGYVTARFHNSMDLAGQGDRFDIDVSAYGALYRNEDQLNTGVIDLKFGPNYNLAAIGIRVNTVAPGLIDTPIYGEGEGAEMFKAKLGESVLFPHRLGMPEELASMVVECVTNSYMNAETIRVDGGIRMPPK